MSRLNSKVLKALIEQQFVSGSELEADVGVSRQAIHGAINDLKDKGVNILTVPRKGYQFLDDGNVLLDVVVKKHLNTKKLGQSNLEILKKVDSTNTYIKKNLSDKINSVVIANLQTKGMGRKGRAFHSGAGGIYMSMLLKPQLHIQKLSLITMAAAVAVCDSLKQICGFNADIKWVNDIYYNGKKLCGISTDATFSAEIGELQSVVLGIGLNMHPVDITLCNHAISIEEIAGKGNFRNTLAAAIINNVEKTVTQLEQNEKDILERYKEHVFIWGKEITIFEHDKIYTATAASLSSTGALIVKLNDGNTKELIAAEVSVKV